MFDFDVLVKDEAGDLPLLAVFGIAEHGGKDGRNVGQCCFGAERTEVRGREFLPAKERRVEAFAGGQTSVEDFLVGVAG